VSATVKQFVCSACGHVHSKWEARCVACQAYNLTPKEVELEEPSPEPKFPRLVSVPAEGTLSDGTSKEPQPVPLSDVKAAEHERVSTGLAPVDIVLGGGLVVASVVLVASPPGSGKSTMALQVLHGLGHRCVYASSEETVDQLAITARRIGAASSQIYPIAERDISKVLQYARVVRAKTIAIDSLQKMVATDHDSRPGQPTQLKEISARIYRYAKDHDTSFWVIGQVTGEDRLAGPRQLEHDADVFLELDVIDAERRALRPVKNRYGSTDVDEKLRMLRMTAEGFVPVDGDGWDDPL
jgi:DNA repair protein RadA/Sms